MTERIARSVKETATRLGVSPRTIWREIAAKRLADTKIGGRTMILAEDETAYLSAQRCAQAEGAK